MGVWRIETGTPDDVDAMGWATSASQRAAWRDAAGRPDVIMLVARTGDVVVGKVLADAGRSPTTLWLWMLSVDPAWRSRGVGAALLDAASELARALGRTTVEGAVDQSNPRARVLYDRLGFEPAGPYIDHVAYVTDDGIAVAYDEPGTRMRKQIS